MLAAKGAGSGKEKQKRERSPVPLRLGLFVLAAAGGFALLQSQLDDLELAEVSPYFYFAIVVQLLPFFLRPKTDPFQPSALTAFFHLVALVPAFTTFIVQRGLSISLLPYVSGRNRIELVQTVLIGYTLGTVAYFVGYYAGLGRRIAGGFPDVAGLEWRRSRLILVSIACFGIFVPVYAIFQSRVGAGLTDITQLAAGKAVWRQDNTMSWMIRGVGFGALPPLLYIALDFQRPKLRRVLISGGLFFAVGFLTTRLGQRGTAIYLAFNALIVVHYLWKRVPVWLIAALTMAALVMTNTLGAYRTPDAQTRPPTPTLNFNATETLVEHEDDRARFAAMAVLFHYFPDRRDYLMGESWGAVLVAFVPRWLWPEKGKAFIWRDTNIIPQLVGAPVPVTYLGLLYANFSWVGIVLGMSAWGAFQRGLYEWLLRNQKDKNVVLLYSLGVMYFAPTMIQLSAAISYLLPVYVFIVFMGKRASKLRAGKEPRARAELPAAPATETAAAE
ncbi:MAG: hypothetical protein R3B70_04070 [Polyangiaceae bacterium]